MKIKSFFKLFWLFFTLFLISISFANASQRDVIDGLDPLFVANEYTSYGFILKKDKKLIGDSMYHTQLEKVNNNISAIVDIFGTKADNVYNITISLMYCFPLEDTNDLAKELFLIVKNLEIDGLDGENLTEWLNNNIGEEKGMLLHGIQYTLYAKGYFRLFEISTVD